MSLLKRLSNGPMSPPLNDPPRKKACTSLRAVFSCARSNASVTANDMRSAVSIPGATAAY
eukprot:CAMPEP_0206328774 /NCGR_PEP_ID=MMETSP0106_2-20121207/22851_1 /ASSEMBLY_ACC=CAM_ASM_000206 /TAXON_ID=81532 /ORGANISM="Acanthoeca-like sp., Strain 10tr" /LENGTH=59 /DNA_ID=CAMNT_0053761461 /DNA_START=54 /DNA_END=230 /DNA_ORIENTATION=-